MKDDYIGDMSTNNYWVVMQAFCAIDYADDWAVYYFNVAVAGGIIFD